MNEFTVTSEVMELDEFDEKRVIDNIQKLLINISNKRKEEEFETNRKN